MNWEANELDFRQMLYSINKGKCQSCLKQMVFSKASTKMVEDEELVIMCSICIELKGSQTFKEFKNWTTLTLGEMAKANPEKFQKFIELQNKELKQQHQLIHANCTPKQ